MPEKWRDTWRRGVAPQLSTRGLEALRQALVSDDTRLLQGVTTSPVGLFRLRENVCEGACALGFCGWQGDGLETVEQVEDYFARLRDGIGEEMGDPNAIRHFTAFWDDAEEREYVRGELLAEVQRTLSERETVHA